MSSCLIARLEPHEGAVATTGDGTKFLANDGTYKSLTENADLIAMINSMIDAKINV